MIPNQFNIRVYGILIYNDKILVSDEFHWNINMTKFPGGGLEFGESIHECLKREFKEELNQEIEVIRPFYHNDFLQISQFNAQHQVLCFYYIVKAVGDFNFEVTQHPFAFRENENQCFRWVELSKLTSDEFTFPIDKKVVELLSEKKAYA